MKSASSATDEEFRMPLFRRKPPRLPLRMPRMDGSSWPDRRDVERRSFAALTLYEMGYREAFEPEAATIADRLVEEVLSPYGPPVRAR